MPIANMLSAYRVTPRIAGLCWKDDLGIFPNFRAEWKLLVVDEACHHPRRDRNGPVVLPVARESNDMIFPLAAKHQRNILAALKQRWAPLSRLERPLNDQ